MVEGETESLSATVLPDNANNKKTNWKSSNAEIASVDNSGRVSAHKQGGATITVTTEDGNKTASCSVTVTAKTISVTAVELNKKDLTLTEGDTETLKATVSPNDATNLKVTWESDKTDIATVDSNGKVTAVKSGSAKITVTTEDGNKTATCDVTVEAKAIQVTGVALNKTSLTLLEGKSETLTPTLSPEDATNKKMTWRSDNTDIATVDSNGKITAVKAGTANIIVTTDDGNKSATCKVTVEAINVPTVEMTNFSISGKFQGDGIINVNARISSDGGSAIIERGVEYEETYKGTIHFTQKAVPGSGIGNFVFSDDDVSVQGEKLRFRAYAKNSAGTGYSEWETAHELKVPTVKILSADVQGDFGNGKGSISVSVILESDGGTKITERGVQYEETDRGSIYYKENPIGNAPDGNFEFNATQIGVQGEMLRYRAYAKNDMGTGYSDWKVAYQED